MAKKRYLRLKDGSVMEIEALPNGQFRGTVREDVSESMKAAAAMRKDMKGHLSKSEAKGTPLRAIASLPLIVADEMDRQCKGDPDKMRAFLRDHPEHLAVPRTATNLPKKKTYIYSRTPAR